MQKKRPCRFCRRWFRPNPRVGKRQIACGEAGCQARRRAATQARWVARNPEYFAGRRLLRRIHAGGGERPREAPLNGLPWEVAEEAFAVSGTVFLVFLSRVVLRYAQDEIRSQLIDSTRDARRHAPGGAQDEIRVEVVEPTGDRRRHAGSAVQDEIRTDPGCGG